jgi:hypothetical protein
MSDAELTQGNDKMFKSSNQTKRSNKANNGQNKFAKANTTPALVSDNARLVTCPNGELNLVYTALGMNVYMTNYAEAMELFELVNVEGLTVKELKAFGFAW